jgi:Flp pilus assembly protein TadD
MSNGSVSAIAAGWIVALTLAVDPWGWYPFGPVKWMVASVGVLALTALSLRSPTMTIAPRLQLAVGLLLAAFALAAALGVDPLYAWVGTPERHFGLLTWILLALALHVGMNLERPEDVLWGTSIAGAALGAASTLEALGWEPRVFDVDRRLSATFGSPAYLGAAVALLLPTCVATALDRTLAWRLRAIAVLAMPLLVVALLGSGARAAWVGSGIAAVAVGVRRRRVLREVLRARRATELVIASAGAIGIAFVIVFLSPVGARAAATFDADRAGGLSRLDEWHVATTVARDHLAFGVGPEGYRIVFAAGVDAAYERAHGRSPAPDRAHSAPLDVLVTGGLGALVPWIAVVALIGRHVWRALVDDRIWLAGFAAALLAYFVGQLLLFPLAELDPIVWLLAGVVVVATAGPHELRTFSPCRRAMWLSAALALAVVALAAGFTDIVADHRARIAVDASGRGDFEAALVEAERAASLRPDIVRLHLLEAQVALDAGRGTVVALRAADAAHDVSPRDPIVRLRTLTLLVDRAEATLLGKDATEARTEVDRAVRDDPYNAELRVLQGRAARLDGDEQAAEQAWRVAEDLAPRSPVPPADLALLYLDQLRFDEASSAVARALALGPDDTFVAAVRARVDAAH